MVTRTLIRLGLPGLVLAGVLLLSPSRAVGSGSFPCSWNWGIDQGLPAGYVHAGINADCFGRGGSLTLGIRLFKYDARSRRWHTEKVKTRTFTNLDGNRGLDITEHCRGQKLRGVFRWTLRDSGGGIAATKVVRSGSVVAVPGCRLVLK
jgi:hypothetical protein